MEESTVEGKILYLIPTFMCRILNYQESMDLEERAVFIEMNQFKLWVKQSPLSVGDTSHDPPWMPETAGSTNSIDSFPMDIHTYDKV